MCSIFSILSLTLTFLAGSLLGGRSHPYHCSGHTVWGSIWKLLLEDLENIAQGPSEHCRHEDTLNLCFPKDMLVTVNYDRSGVLQILEEMYNVFSQSQDSSQAKRFLIGLAEAHARLKENGDNVEMGTFEPVIRACYEQISKYLIDHSHSRCAWEIIYSHSREILQRLKNVTPCEERQK